MSHIFNSSAHTYTHTHTHTHTKLSHPPMCSCPGLNNVISEITKTLYRLYGIGGTVYGIQGGYAGFHDPNLEPIILTPELVENIHYEGGTVLGSSRGGFDLEKIINFLKAKKINQLYVIGGDGTHRGAFRIHEGCMEHGMNVAVAGIPKTIDNDVDYIDRRWVNSLYEV